MTAVVALREARASKRRRASQVLAVKKARPVRPSEILAMRYRHVLALKAIDWTAR